MTRSIFHRLLAAFAAYLALGAVASANGLPVQTPGMVAAVASIGEGREGSLDAAARLTAAGRYEEAFAALEPDADSLRMGIIASLAERYEGAIGLLRRPSSNPHLERLRLYHVARSFLGAGRFAEALAAVRGIPYPPGTRREHSDRFYARAREMEAAILAECDSLLAAEGLPPDAAKLPGRARFFLGRALLRAGKDSVGASEIAGACRGYWAPEDRGVLEEALELCERYYPDMRPEDLRETASIALSAGLYGAARGIVEHLLARDAGDGEALLLKASLVEKEKGAREAAALCNEILDSGASSETKKEAHRRLAYLEYDLGHRERAVDLCREHADRFNDWGLLSLGARIDISLGRLDRAFAAFCEILAREESESAPARVDDVAAAAALGCVLGRAEEAFRIIEARASRGQPPGARYGDRGRGSSPPLLYWLWKTAPDGAERERLLSALTGDHPRSWYACAARGHLDSLFAGMRGTAAADRVGRMAADDGRYVDSLAASFGTDNALAGGEAYAAYRYFLDCGLVREASDCLAALGRAGGVGSAGAMDLYRDARNRGFHDLAMKLLNAPPGNALDGETVGRLQYPVAFPGAIASGGTAGIPAELMLAVMREESAFDPDAVSRAGAIGLMQLMPSTARWMARRHGWQGIHCNDLHDPACNVAVGARYLAYLLGRFDGSIVGALAAYNGGEGRMARWRKQFDPSRDPMVAMALIGPRETRSYVGKVLESMCRYRAVGATGQATTR